MSKSQVLLLFFFYCSVSSFIRDFHPVHLFINLVLGLVPILILIRVLNFNFALFLIVILFLALTQLH